MKRPFIVWRRAALACAALLATAIIADSARAADRRVTSSSVIPLSGTVNDSNTGFNVMLTGWLHIVTHVTIPNDPVLPVSIDAYINLPAMDVIAVNQSYPDVRYIVYGAASTQVQWSNYLDQPSEADLQDAFILTLLPPNPVRQGLPPNPVRLGVRIQWLFDTDGQLVTPGINSDTNSKAVVY